ncbi:MAG: T9SS type A sorting domain-containing protein [Bacteroidetes bacterium]|nr:T9SS type A sorting domain-containing protein [Bacteroidota bacterium]
MKTILQKAAAICLFAIPSLMSAQVDLTIGLNYSYNPPTNCNNQITSLSVDICNNGSSSAGSFLVGVYLYETSSQKHWVLDQTTINSLSGNACITISNWNIDMNNYCCLPAPASNYRIGVWADTANAITETSKSNNASLLSGNIQVCAASTGIKNFSANIKELSFSPNPVADKGELKFVLAKEEKVNVTISDITGKVISTLYTGTMYQGEQKIDLNTSSYASGVYFVKVRLSDGEVNKKIIVQK